MLLNFSCANHKSIMNEVNFSMIASKNHTVKEKLKEYGKYRILNSAVIYGTNGSGKSNLLESLSYMQSLVTTSILNQPGEIINQYPNKLSGNENPSTYNIQFVKNNIRYAYGFSIKNNIIDEEYLYYYPKKKKVKIFERKGLNIEESNKYKQTFNLVVNDILKENRLLLSCLANFTTLEEIKRAFLFFLKDIVFYNPSVNNCMQYSLKSMINNKDLKDNFIQVIQDFDTGIRDVKISINKMNNLEAKIIYGHFETDLLTEESAGVKKLFEIICLILDVLKNDKILICDELENSLHKSIVYKIVKMFSRKTNNSFPQLIFTTHNISLLSSNCFKRDQIWFTKLNKHNTNLYSLIEFKNVHKIKDLSKLYQFYNN